MGAGLLQCLKVILDNDLSPASYVFHTLEVATEFGTCYMPGYAGMSFFICGH